jgi:hypothetical protein
VSAGCGHESKPPPRTTTSIEPASPAPIAEVPANTAFRVNLEDTLSSAVSYPGQTFKATLRTPLVSRDVRVAAPAGSIVHGHVVAVQSGKEPRVAVAFDSIETKSGSYGIEAHANAAFDAPFAIASARSADEAEADSVFQPGGGAIGGGPPPEDIEIDGVSTTMVILPRDTEIELVLTSPITVRLVP